MKKQEKHKVELVRCKKCSGEWFIKELSFIEADEFADDYFYNPKIKCKNCKTPLDDNFLNKLFSPKGKDCFENIGFVKTYLETYNQAKDKHSKTLVDFLYRIGRMPYKKAKKILEANLDQWVKMWPFTEANEKFDNVTYGTILAICGWIIEKRK